MNFNNNKKEQKFKPWHLNFINHDKEMNERSFQGMSCLYV